MRLEPSHDAVEIGRNRSVWLRGAAGVEIVCIRGCLWVTEDGRLEDRILEPGRSHRIAGRDRVIVTALEAGAMRTVGTAVPARPGSLEAIHRAVSGIRTAARAWARGFVRRARP